MFCQNCGKELLDSNDKYCRYCGTKLNISKEIKTDNVSSQYNIPSLKWFNFFYKIYLPIVIILNFIFTLPQVLQFAEAGGYNIFSIFYLILCITLYIIIPFLAYLKIEKSKETGYRFILIFLICDYVYRVIFTSVTTAVNYADTLSTCIVLSTLIYAIWYVPNIVYFIKRRNYFLN